MADGETILATANYTRPAGGKVGDVRVTWRVEPGTSPGIWRLAQTVVWPDGSVSERGRRLSLNAEDVRCLRDLMTTLLPYTDRGS